MALCSKGNNLPWPNHAAAKESFAVAATIACAIDAKGIHCMYLVGEGGGGVAVRKGGEMELIIG